MSAERRRKTRVSHYKSKRLLLLSRALSLERLDRGDILGREVVEIDDFVRHHYPVIDALKRGDGPAARQAIADDIVASGIKIDDIPD